MKIIKTERRGENSTAMVLISVVFILCPLWPLAHLYLCCFHGLTTGNILITVFFLNVKYSISGLFIMLKQEEEFESR